MRIVVTSDSHNNRRDLYKIFERHMDTTDLFINLGDGERDIDNVLLLYPDIKIQRVAGNCDWESALPYYKTIKAGGKTIFITHGHPFYVKHGYQELERAAREAGADICLFGHTHTPCVYKKDNIRFMNPGAVASSSYGIIDIVDSGIMMYNQTV